MKLLLRILALIAAGVFIYAGALKVMDPVRFASDIDNYHILPWAVGVRLAFYLPWLEILCGIALIVRFWYSGALVILTAMTVVFIVATITAKVRGIDITCGCFGHASKGWTFSGHMALDLGLLATFVVLLLQHAKSTRSA